MHVKTLLIALMGLAAAADAAELAHHAPISQVLNRRQSRGGGGRLGGIPGAGARARTGASAGAGARTGVLARARAGAGAGARARARGGGGSRNLQNAVAGKGKGAGKNQRLQNGGNGGNGNGGVNAGNGNGLLNTGNGNGGVNGRNGNGGGNLNNLALDPQVIQQASATDGNTDTASGEAASDTSNNNFINFCAQSNKDLTNGEQNEQGSCNGIPMGEIPAKTNMVSSRFVFSRNNQVIGTGTFNVQVQVNNLNAGSFTNAQNTYYSAPQSLDDTGMIKGHTHVVIQLENQIEQPQVFAFFKGINDAGNGRGRLQVTVNQGLPPGNYRLCNMSSAANHQPVLMPIAQRSAQDDCVRFKVRNNGGRNGRNRNIAVQRVGKGAKKAAKAARVAGGQRVVRGKGGRI